MEYAKNVLAPFALDAFPEAYDLFKSLLSLLIYLKKEHGQIYLSENAPLSMLEDFSEETRDQLAESLGITFAYLEGPREPLFSQLIK